MKTDNNIYNDEINLVETISILSNDRKLIFYISTCIVSLFILISLALNNVYTSSALLMSNSKSDSMSSLLDSYSNLAGIAGVNLPSNQIDNKDEAVERIQSFDFFQKYFLPNIKLENLLATKKWDQKDNKLIYKASEFDSKHSKWVRNVKFPKTVIPSDIEAYEEYKEIINLKEDNKTGFISLSIEHKSPYIAKKWADLIIYYINESMRENDKTNAISSINFLNEQYRTTQVSEIKDAISRLTITQMQTLMMASAKEDYMFTVIDSPVVPEEKSFPPRLIIIIFGIILGVFSGISFSLLRFYYNKKSL